MNALKSLFYLRRDQFGCSDIFYLIFMCTDWIDIDTKQFIQLPNESKVIKQRIIGALELYTKVFSIKNSGS